jgi:DNA-binding beta-propeller fold protein YncE
MVVDPFHPRLYIADQTTNAVVVFDTESNREIGTIPIGMGLHGMDVSVDGRELYVALTDAAALAVVNLTSLTVSRRIALQSSPWDVAAGRLGRAYVTSGGTFAAMIVDTVNNTEVGTFPLDSQGGEIRASLDRNFVYVAIEGLDPTNVLKWSVRTDTPVLVGETAFGSVGGNFRDMAVSPDNITLLIASGYPYRVVVENTNNWTQRGTLPYVGGYPSSVSFSQDGKVAFATDGLSHVYRYNMTTFQLLATYKLTNDGRMVRGVPNGSKAFVLTSDVYGGSNGLEAIGVTPPTWPNGSRVTVSNLTPSSVTIAWTPASDVVPVEDYDLSAGNIHLATVPGTTLSYTISNLQPGAVYPISVEATDGTFWTVNGPSITVITPSQPQSRPPSILSLLIIALPVLLGFASEVLLGFVSEVKNLGPYPPVAYGVLASLASILVTWRDSQHNIQERQTKANLPQPDAAK